MNRWLVQAVMILAILSPGGRRGNLIVRLKVKGHPKLQRIGSTISSSIHIPWAYLPARKGALLHFVSAAQQGSQQSVQARRHYVYTQNPVLSQALVRQRSECKSCLCATYSQGSI